MFNCPEFVISYYAVLRINATVVPVNPGYTAAELSVILKDCSPSAIITSSIFWPKFQSLKNSLGPKTKFILTESAAETTEAIPFNKLITQNEPAVNKYRYSGEEVVELLYTSGTTGEPKGVMLTHKNLFSNVSTIAKMLKMEKDDRVLLVAPAYHSAAQTGCMNNAIYSGATLIIHNRWQGAKSVLETIEKEKITMFFGPPIFYALICHYPQCRDFDLSSLRLVLTGAAPLPEHVFKKFKELFELEIIEGYGLSEASPVVSLTPPYGLKKSGSVGLPIEGVKVTIIDDSGAELPRGRVGEIAVKGPNVMKGYYNKVEETKKALHNGWLRTGDLGYLDEDGYIFVVDRKKDLIIKGGVNIYPREIEKVLNSHHDVLETAVVGVPDSLHGEEIKAFIVTKSGQNIDPGKLKGFCIGKIANFKIPKYFQFVKELPKNSAGKVLKRELVKNI
ncbi:long-chain acyl-CoA synthetase [Desulfohalotomaculum tongense]|nr:long-chain acyl-CoA synthetase [Desulforadius tongensis]